MSEGGGGWGSQGYSRTQSCLSSLRNVTRVKRQEE